MILLKKKITPSYEDAPPSKARIIKFLRAKGLLCVLCTDLARLRRMVLYIKLLVLVVPAVICHDFLVLDCSGDPCPRIIVTACLYSSLKMWA